MIMLISVLIIFHLAGMVFLYIKLRASDFWKASKIWEKVVILAMLLIWEIPALAAFITAFILLGS